MQVTFKIPQFALNAYYSEHKNCAVKQKLQISVVILSPSSCAHRFQNANKNFNLLLSGLFWAWLISSSLTCQR